MKINTKSLKKIIKEEVEKVLKEQTPTRQALNKTSREIARRFSGGSGYERNVDAENAAMRTAVATQEALKVLKSILAVLQNPPRQG